MTEAYNCVTGVRLVAMETAVYKKVSLEDGEEEGDVEAPLRGGSTARSDEDDGRADSSPVKGAPAAAPGGALGEQELDEHHTTMEKLYYLLCMSLPISLGFFLNLGSAFINLGMCIVSRVQVQVLVLYTMLAAS